MEGVRTMPMEELSERARRVLGDVSDGSIQGDLTAALDRIELLTMYGLSNFELDILQRIRNGKRTIGLLTSTLSEVQDACMALEKEGLVSIDGIHVVAKP